MKLISAITKTGTKCNYYFHKVADLKDSNSKNVTLWKILIFLDQKAIIL